MRLILNQRGRFNPTHLPCGCPCLRHVVPIGIDGELIEGLVGLNTQTGWMKVQRWVVDPSFILKPLVRAPDGAVTQRRVVREGGVALVQCVAPVELHCKVHGRVA